MRKIYFSVLGLIMSFSVFSQCAFTLSVTPVDVSCFGLCDGSASVLVSGGTGPYTYTWNPGGATTDSINGLCPGTFWCIVEEAGCKDSASFTINEPTQLAFTPSYGNVLCYGECTGTISPLASGGISPYTFSYSGGSDTNLCAGSYIAYVSDDNGCMDSLSIVIIEPASPLSVTVTPTDITCYGTSNGSASASVSGGTPSYNYSWSTNPVETAPNAFNLPVGTVTVVVTDNAGCADTVSVNINQPPQIIISQVSTSSVTCYGGSDGSATMSASGGVPSITGFTYLWSPGGQADTIATGLSAGTYSFSVTDSLNCKVTQTVSITEPAQFTASAIQTNLCGGTSGDASVNIIGGTPSYNFSWSPGGNTEQSITGLTAGTYTVLVTDGNLCTASDTVTIILNPTVTATLTTTNITCPGDTNGTASVIAGGGTPSYTYLWLPGGDTTTSVSNLSLGNYTITVTDSLGCAVTNTFVIGGATVLSLSTSNTHICGAGTGSSTVTATGGTPGYQYSWNTGSTVSALTGLPAGNYSCVVTDSVGCIDTAFVKIIASADLAVLYTITPITCFGDSNATITVSSGGGIAPHTYVWAPGGGTSTSVSGLGPSTFTVTVTDSIGCTANDVITIVQPALLTTTVSGVDATCNGCSDGTASASASGGTGSLSYSWSNGSTTANVTGLAAGSYTVCVSDSLGCDSCSVVIISEPPSGIGKNITSSVKLQTEPVPFGNFLLIKYENKTSGDVLININNTLGESVFSDIIQESKIYNRPIDTSALPGGIYFVSVSNNKETLITRKIIKANQ